MNARKGGTIVLLSLVAAGCSDREARHVSGSSLPERPMARSQPAVASGGTGGGNGRVDRPSATSAQKSALDIYRCLEPASCTSDLLSASSEAEARWLQVNGYPAERELKALEALGDAQLADRVKKGSLPAMVVYGERLSLAGNTQTGMTLLLDAANRGSLYAYYGFSNVYRQVPGLRDHIEAAAYLRVAYILGDSKAAQQMLSDFPGYGPADYSVVDRRASQLYKTLARERRPSVRPSE
ncbi:MAG TPA: hypothetical protein VIT90_14040 [Lysobacter sp.]